MKVSVIVPNYNYEEYLSLRLESIFNQTFQDFEVIILDDNSLDNSKNVIEKYRDHPNVSHIIYNEKNSGSPFIQWNRGIEVATGDWIWVAEVDDLADNTFLEKLLFNAQNDNEVVLSYCQSYRMDVDGHVTGDWNGWTDDLDKDLFKCEFVLDGMLYLEKYLHKKNTIPNVSGIIFKKDAYLKAGKVNEDLKYSSDWLLWLKLLTFGKIAFCPEKLNYFRYHQKSVIRLSVTNREDIELKKKFIRFLESSSSLQNNKLRYNKLIEFFNYIISNDYEYEANCLKNKGLKKESIKYMFEALKYRKNKMRIFYRLLFSYILPSNIQLFLSKVKMGLRFEKDRITL